jgi:hypothetical protein
VNYFAHGFRFIDDPYYLAGTAVPDWLNVTDRRVRARSKHALPLVDDEDPRVAALARGIVQHHRDDGWFHETTEFAQLSWQFTVHVRDALPADDGLRPSFLGHILVEILLDASLIAEHPQRLEAYYRAMAEVDGSLVQATVNRIAPRAAENLGQFVPLFVRERFLWDYLDDGKLCYRLNQVMRRVGLSTLPPAFRDLLPNARRQVTERRQKLLGEVETVEAAPRTLTVECDASKDRSS